MPGGIQVGSAYFTIEGDASGVIQALNQAQQASQKSVQAISAATGIAERDVQRLAQIWIRSEKQRADASAREALRIIKAHNDAAEGTKKLGAASDTSSAQVLSLVKGLGGFAAAATGVATGAAAVHQAMTKIAESTQRAAQAQFALNKLYGASAPLVIEQANALAKLSGQSRTAAQEAAANVATLQRNYALTGGQLQQVLKISADLAAVRGITIAQASERVESALRGEAEAIEYLGQALNSDALKGLADMTDEQRKYFETLSPITKSQIVLNALVKNTADLQGAAAERANSNVGAFDKLSASTENLAASIGERLAPSAATGARGLAALADATDRWVRSLDQQKVDAFIANLTKAAIVSTLGPVGIPIAATLGVTLPAEKPAGQGPQFGPTPDEVRDAQQQQRQADADEKDRIKALTAQRTKALSDAADAEERYLRRQADLREKAYDAEITRLEVERAARLKNLDERERATIKTIEAESRASEQAFQAEIDRLEREKAARTQAAEDAAEQAKRGIEAAKQQRELDREQQDRARDDARRTEDQQTEDARRSEDRTREEAQKAEIHRIEELRDVRIAAIQADIEAEEDRSRTALRHLDDEADRARAASEKRIRGIEQAGDREDERHRRAMQAIQDEGDARLAVIDAQLKALDIQERTERSVHRVADLQRKLADAQTAATRARGTGTPEQIAQARGDLTRALRVGDEVSIANARERLVQLAGQGAEAIQKADEDLAKAQQDLQDEVADSARDAERDKLRAEQDRVRQEIENEKRQEDDRSRRRKRDLDGQKQAEQDKLKSTLDRLDKAKQAEQDASREELKLLKNGVDAEKQAAADEIQAARDKYDAQFQILQDRRRDEDRFREDQRRAQDRQREDERKAEDDALAAQLQAVQDTLRDERRQIEEHYNGADGILTKVRKAMDDSKLAYQQRLDDARLKFQAERDLIKAVYTNEAKTGLIDLQNAAKDNNKTQLDQQITDLRDWEQNAKTEIENNTARWKTLEQAIKDVDAAMRRLPSGRVLPPGGVGPVAPPGYGGQPGGDTAVPEQPANPVQAPMGDPTRVYVPVVRKAGAGSYWTSAGTHGGHPAADIFAERGTPIYAPVGGRMVPLSDSKGGNAAIEHGDNGYAYYFAHGNVPFVGGRVRQGQQIGEVGNTGNAQYTSPHLHFAIATDSRLFDTYGGSGDVNGDSTYWVVARDAGYLFRHPTLTYTPATGETNLIAERRPERLLGGAATAALHGSGSLVGPAPLPNYAAMGRFMASAHPSVSGGWRGESGASYVEGDVIFNGLTYDQAEARQRREQRRRSLLHGPLRLR